MLEFKIIYSFWCTCTLLFLSEGETKNGITCEQRKKMIIMKSQIHRETRETVRSWDKVASK